jgi:ubiquinone/menaquinone biosynthesis C-methylase UbiE
MSKPSIVEKHYGRMDGPALIKAIQHLALEDFTAIDELHIGGAKATSSFFDHIQAQKSQHILDIGCGLGGPARSFAKRYDANVTGIDLTPSYIQAANWITQETQQTHQCDFHVVDACGLPFPDESFHHAYSIHTSMNIENKDMMLGEAYRVLKTGGIAAFYDVVAGQNDALLFPLPWAQTSQTSFLEQPDIFVERLSHAGFDKMQLIETTNKAIQSLQKAIQHFEKAPEKSYPTALIMGGNFLEKMSNLLYNLEHDQCKAMMIIATKRV